MELNNTTALNLQHPGSISLAAAGEPWAKIQNRRQKTSQCKEFSISKGQSGCRTKFLLVLNYMSLQEWKKEKNPDFIQTLTTKSTRQSQLPYLTLQYLKKKYQVLTSTSSAYSQVKKKYWRNWKHRTYLIKAQQTLAVPAQTGESAASELQPAELCFDPSEPGRKLRHFISSELQSLNTAFPSWQRGN